MIKQARRICSSTLVIILLTIAVQADDEKDPPYVAPDGERVVIQVVPLQPDGKPVALDMPQLQAIGIAAFAALTDDFVAVSVGDDAEAQLQSMLSAEVADPAPFLSFSMDAARYYGFLGEAIAAGEHDQDNAPSPEMQAAMNELMQAIAEVYDRMTIDIRFTENGVEFVNSVTLKD